MSVKKKSEENQLIQFQKQQKQKQKKDKKLT